MNTLSIIQKNRSIIIQTIFTLVFVSLILVPLLVNGQERLVDCGREDPTDCNFQALVATANRIINFIITIAGSFAAILFAYAGFMYLTAQGDTGKISQAHNIFKSVLVGFVVILVAWLIVYTLLNTLLHPSRVGKVLQFFQN